MPTLDTNPAFLDAYNRLKDVSLNPTRHTASNAHEHSELVYKRVAELARLNECGQNEIALLEDLARLHDIGKVSGSTNPVESVALLPSLGVTDPLLISLVKYHDVNLPWFMSAQRGEAPSDKAWMKLVGRVDIRLLCIFMVADRVDCPGGWRANAPLVWFLQQAEVRGLLAKELVLDDGPEVSRIEGNFVELSAGALLVWTTDQAPQALLIRVRREGFEVPKGHVAPGESAAETALRELQEETGLLSNVRLGDLLGTLSYALGVGEGAGTKSVSYYAAGLNRDEQPRFGPLPRRTRELRWVTIADLADVPLVNEELRSIVEVALS